MAKKEKTLVGDRLVGFREAWTYCVEEGWCDDPFGAEYTRILSAWLAAGMPHPISQFIRLAANSGVYKSDPSVEEKVGPFDPKGA